MSKFKSGFAWIRIGGYSYICKIEGENDGFYTVSLDNYTIYRVPENELICAIVYDKVKE